MADPLLILLVDDDATDREAIRRLLPRAYRVLEATTLREARVICREEQPGLILLDYQLPDGDGVELLPERAEGFIPVVMLTGMEAPEVIVEAMQAGAQDYLVKNALTAEALGRAIAYASEKAALQRALAEQQRALEVQAARLAEQAAALEVKNREVRALAAALTDAEQEERRRVAHVLHDDLQQLLFGANFAVQLLQQPIDDCDPADVQDALNKGLARVSRILADAARTTRNLALELTPPALEREDLAEVLRWLARHTEELHGLRVAVEADGQAWVPPQNVRVLLVQLVRELLFNVAKHAGVKEARISVSDGDGYREITVEDSGHGFAPDAAHGGPPTKGRTDGPAHAVLDRNEAGGGLGLTSIRHRLGLLGGRLDIRSEPGGGTRATIVVPHTTG